MFLAEMSTARFVAFEGVEAHQLGELEEIGDASGALQRLIEVCAVARDAHVVPKFFAEFGDFAERFAEAVCVPSHSTFVPKKRSELAVDGIERAFAIHSEEPVDFGAHVAL